jgi:glutathione-regulated potassium-efflux system protein KefB
MEAATHATHLLRDGAILLGAALVFVLAFQRLGLGAVLGYLMTGIVLGDFGLGLIDDAQSKLKIAELGVILLLFVVGLELNAARLWQMRRDIFALGGLQMLLSALALWLFVGGFTNFTWGAALALAMALALSSTAQILPMLRDRSELDTPVGRRAFSVLLAQDISIVPLIAIIALLSRAPANPAAAPGWQLALLTLGAVVGLVLAGRLLIGPLFRLIARLGITEMFAVAGLFTVIAAAGTMEALGLSPALGAFIAGVMLADSPYRNVLERDIEPFRSVLLGLFFVSVGMALDVTVLVTRPFFVLGLAAGVIAIKVFVLFWLARAFGLRRRQALALGLLLCQGGEFGFVLFSLSEKAMLILPQASTLFSAIITVSMAATPILVAIAERHQLIHAGPPDAAASAPSSPAGER